MFFLHPSYVNIVKHNWEKGWKIQEKICVGKEEKYDIFFLSCCWKQTYKHSLLHFLDWHWIKKSKTWTQICAMYKGMRVMRGLCGKQGELQMTLRRFWWLCRIDPQQTLAISFFLRFIFIFEYILFFLLFGGKKSYSPFLLENKFFMSNWDMFFNF